MQCKDSFAIRALKTRFSKYLDKKFKVSEHNVIATFLTPEFRSLPKKFPRSKTVVDAMQLLNGYLQEVQESNDEDEQNQISESIEEPRLFSCFREQVVQPHPVMNEATVYANTGLTKQDIDKNLIDFWTSKKDSYPKLFKIALWILSCPATSASSERVFSKLGQMITDLKNGLKPETVNRQSFLSSNGDLF